MLIETEHAYPVLPWLCLMLGTVEELMMPVLYHLNLSLHQRCWHFLVEFRSPKQPGPVGLIHLARADVKCLGALTAVSKWQKLVWLRP